MQTPGQIHPVDMAAQKWFYVIGQFATLVLLGVAVVYFERRQTRLEERLLQCQTEKIDRLTAVIERNSDALQALTINAQPFIRHEK